MSTNWETQIIANQTSLILWLTNIIGFFFASSTHSHFVSLDELTSVASVFLLLFILKADPPAAGLFSQAPAGFTSTAFPNIYLACNESNSISILIDWEVDWISTVSMNRTYGYIFMSKLSMPRNICWHWSKLMQNSLNLYYWINLPSRTGWLNANCLWRRIPSPCCSWELLGILLDGVFVPLPKPCQTSS